MLEFWLLGRAIRVGNTSDLTPDVYMLETYYFGNLEIGEGPSDSLSY